MSMTPLHRSILASTLMVALSATTQATPREPGDSAVRAPVISSVPVYRTINEPRTECWTETVGHGHHHYRQDSNGGAVLGAIAGGLLGSTVGRGNGRIAAAAIGAATGAVVGDRMESAYAAGPREVERCETQDNYRRTVQGYDVRYRYQGREYSTRMPYDPGRYVTLRVSVEVEDDPRHEPDRDDER
jgi:uncharacterized protein YcfJ